MAKSGPKRKCYSFEECRELVRGEALGSYRQYAKWYAINRPARVPKRPDRAYKKQWLGWSDFLGSNNPFPCIKKAYRPFKEARAFAHALKFKSIEEWKAWAKTPEKPMDIPSRPDLAYGRRRNGEWFTWRDFLGYTAVDRIASIQETQNILYILKPRQTPVNVYKIGVTNGGKSAIFAAKNVEKFDILRLFDIKNAFDWKTVLAQYSTPYWHGNGENEYVVYSINDYLNFLSEHLDRIN